MTKNIHIEYLAELQTICQSYWKRIVTLEGDKYDLERGCVLKKLEVKRLKNVNKNHSTKTTTTTKAKTKSVPTKMTFDWIE